MTDPPIAIRRHAETGLVVKFVRAIIVGIGYQTPHYGPLCRVVEPGDTSYRVGELAMVNCYGEGWERERGD